MSSHPAALRIAAMLWLAAAAAPSQATVLPPGFVETLVVDGLGSATASVHSPDGRIFVAEQGGTVRVIKDGALLATPFAQLDANTTGERGLLGIGLHPAFPATPVVYVWYAAESVGAMRLSALVADGDVALPFETVLVQLPPYGTAVVHFGGGVHFGPDGKLYLGVGDHLTGMGAQLLDNPFGKMLRLEPDGSIPTDNPFLAETTGLNRAIWARGLRNPFTFGFDPGTGRLFIDDVGQQTWEEINLGVAGANYGWPITEGPTDDPAFTSPVFAYSPPLHGGCALTAGTFYSPPEAVFPPIYTGGYFYADFCSRYIRWLDTTTYEWNPFASGLPGRPVDLDVGPDGNLYHLVRVGEIPREDDTAAIYRITYTGSLAPQITDQPESQTVFVGDPATFVVGAAGAESLQWQRDEVDIPGATGSSYTLAATTLADSGAVFRVIATNEFGSTPSADAVLTVTDNEAPTASITITAPRPLYRAGDVIQYAGTATDPEDGPLGAAAFTWQVNFHHDTHSHPFVPPTPGSTSGSFTIPTVGETDPDVWYRVILRVEDAGGRTFVTTADVLPELATLTLDTDPPGLAVDLDDQPGTAPRTVTGVVNLTRTVGTPASQLVGNVPFAFSHWSDGGARRHTIATPPGDTTLVAHFVPPGTPTTTTTSTTSTTSTTLPPTGCAGPCDDADPCTQDGCDGVACTHAPLAGIAAASCVCDRALPEACSAAAMPLRLQRRAAVACLRLTRAETSSERRALTLLRGAARAWIRAAVLVERRTGAAGWPDPLCASALTARFREATVRAQGVRAALAGDR